MTAIQVAFCCNDPDNGSPTGRIDAVRIRELIHVAGPIEERNGVDGDLIGSTVFAANKRFVVIAGKYFPHRGYSTWVGNWCWDAAWMMPADALDLLNHLKGMEWVCEEAECSLFERWKQPGELTMDDLVAAGLEVAS